MISMIVAMAKNRVIADDSGIPWQGDLPADVKHFRDTTEGATVLMGRKVYEEFNQPLENRRNLVLTHQMQSELRPGFEAIATIEAVLELAKTEPLYIIGGSSIYTQFLPFTDQLIISTLDAEFEGNVIFPEFNQADWHVHDERHVPADADNCYSFTIQWLNRAA